MLGQKSQAAAGPVINSCDDRGNEKVQRDAQDIGAGTAVESFSSKQSCGNHFGDVPSEEDASLEQIESPGDNAAGNDCQQNAPPAERPSRGISDHWCPRVSPPKCERRLYGIRRSNDRGVV